MSVADILVIALLAFGVGMELTSVVGILVGSGRLRRASTSRDPASTFTPLAFAVAVAIDFGAHLAGGAEVDPGRGVGDLLGPGA